MDGAALPAAADAGAHAAHVLDGAGDGAAAHGARGHCLGHQPDAQRQQCLGPFGLGEKWGETHGINGRN